MYVYFVVARNLLVFVKKVSPTLHRFADPRAVLVRGYHRLPYLPPSKLYNVDPPVLISLLRELNDELNMINELMSV